jgi:hypothetical protein
MKITRIGIVTLALLMLSSIALANVKGAAWPNLPSTMVQLTAVDGTTSYFMSTLSGVPAGFDVQNETYPGWCIDRSVTMIRGVPHNVLLYSSLSPPPALSGINWIAINYILNHKQGTMMDVQEAIWHFTDALSSIGPTAQAMVDAANANPSYDPLTGEVLAVICLPQDDPSAQNSIIEIPIPPPPPPHYEGLTPGFWKNHVDCWVGYSPSDKFADVFGVTITIGGPGGSDPTLLQVLGAGGGVNEKQGVYIALGRHAVAALLNAAHPHIDYPMTEQEVIEAVYDAITNTDKTDAEPLKDMLDTYNNAGGGIDAHCNPVCADKY